MKIEINKGAVSFVLAGCIALTTGGCGRVVDTPEQTEVPITIVDNTKTVDPEPTVNPIIEEIQKSYTNRYGQDVDLNALNRDVYEIPKDGDKYTLFNGACIYYKQVYNITNEEVNPELRIVTVEGIGSKYSVIRLSDDQIAYVDNTYLIKCPNLHTDDYVIVERNKDTIFSSDAYVYDVSGQYLKHVKAGDPCHIVATNGEYTLVTFADGTSGYVLDITIVSNYEEINGYVSLKAGTQIYSNKILTKSYRTTGDEVVQIAYTTGRYAAIYDEDLNDYVYVNHSDLSPNFIVVCLGDQRMYCYLNYQLERTYPTRTGRDGSLTHTGAFDIDAKVSDWEFTTFPGSFAKYWIPIDPGTQEGIHDLVGDNEAAYGDPNNRGSHGCIRVPREASEYVYNNYEVGDMVYVCNDYSLGDTIIYNYQSNTILVRKR